MSWRTHPLIVNLYDHIPASQPWKTEPPITMFLSNFPLLSTFCVFENHIYTQPHLIKPVKSVASFLRLHFPPHLALWRMLFLIWGSKVGSSCFTISFSHKKGWINHFYYTNCLLFSNYHLYQLLNYSVSFFIVGQFSSSTKRTSRS